MTERYPTVPQVVYPVETLSKMQHDTRDLISHLGEIVELPLNVPRYTTCHTSIIATGKERKAPGELYHPAGVTIHQDTHQIFVANYSYGKVEIFSETGECLYQLGVGQLSEPFGISTHGDSVYVSCWDHTVSKYSLSEMCRVKRIGSEGSNSGQFNFPCQLTTDTIGLVYIADSLNDRICIHDPDLNHLRNITYESITEPYDVKVSRDRMYVLCPDNNPCLHVLTLKGEKLHSLVTCGKGMDVSEPIFFCLDYLKNFVISDYGSHSIRVFSPEGNLLYTIGREGHQQGMFNEPTGVAIAPNGRLVCVSRNMNYGLQIFY